MKKFFKTLIVCLVIIPCLYFLVGCNDTQTPNLTKQQYAMAFEAVAKSFNINNNLNNINNKKVSLAAEDEIDDGYTDFNYDVSNPLISFIKLILQNESYELTTDTIQTDILIENEAYEDFMVKLRLRLAFDGESIIGFLAIAMPNFEEVKNPETMEQGEVIDIKYDFKTNTLISYEIDQYSYLSNRDDFDRIIYKDGKIYKLDTHSSKYDEKVKEVETNYFLERAKVPVNKDYDFSKEFNEINK